MTKLYLALRPGAMGDYYALVDQDNNEVHGMTYCSLEFAAQALPRVEMAFNVIDADGFITIGEPPCTSIGYIDAMVKEALDEIDQMTKKAMKWVDTAFEPERELDPIGQWQ